jgi:hypothetical protein
MDLVARLATDDPATARAYQALCAEPAAGRHEQGLTAAVATLLARRPQDVAPARALLADADAKILIDVHRGARYRPETPPVDLADVVAWCSRAGCPPAAPRQAVRGSALRDTEVLVAIAFRDRAGGRRVRNLLACVAALRDQTFPAGRVTVAVAEADDEPRWRHLIEPVVDRYLFIRNEDRFNLSWAINVAVMNSAPQAAYLCLLDADILADRSFLQRNVTRLHTGEHDAHLPFELMTCLDEPSTALALRRRCEQGEPDVDAADVRALLLHHVYGPCVWVRRELYERVGGLDERYRGWGGEDDDFYARLQIAGTVVSFTDQLLHLAHPRPPMQHDDGRPFNAHIPPLSWTGAAGFGRVAGPSRVVAEGSPV